MAESQDARNKSLVLKACDTLFNKRDYAAAERLWQPNCLARNLARPKSRQEDNYEPLGSSRHLLFCPV